ASISFTVINQGPVEAKGTWTDRVYLSLDDKITSDDILVSSLTNVSALDNGEEYTQVSATFKIPVRFRGTVYALAIADAGGGIDEWPNENNNIFRQPIFVNPWPFADMVVSDVVVPALAFEGDTVEVRYTVTNLGSGPTDIGAWTEQIWLTIDRNRPHPGTGDILLKTIAYDGGIVARNGGYDRVVTVQLPEKVTSGRYYLTPWVDPYAQILEDTLATNINPDDPAEVNNNNYKARAIDIIGIPPVAVPVLRPDLQIVSIVPQASAFGGDDYTLTYTVKNVGPGETGTSGVDRIYLASAPTLSSPGVTTFLLDTVMRDVSLASGGSYTKTLNLRLNPAAQGHYIIVDSIQTNDLTPDDNDGFGATDVRQRAPDLKVTSVTPALESSSGEKTVVRYTVTNDGTAPIWSGTEYWTDQIWLSKDPVFARERATLLTSVVQPNGPLGAGASYTRDVEVTLPPGIGGTHYIYVFANAEARGGPWPVVGGGNDGLSDLYRRRAFEDHRNNEGRGTLPVIYREPDLRVTDFVVPDIIAAGTTQTLTFTVTNVGDRETREASWTDRVFLSLDASLDESDYLLKDNATGRDAQYVRSTKLGAGASYTATVSATLPFDIDGPFYLIAATDTGIGRSGWAKSSISPRLDGVRGSSTGNVREFLGEGNNVTSNDVIITPYAAPDLQVTSLTAPERAVRGQGFDVTYTVRNLGGDTPPEQANWDDLIYLSRDTFLDIRADVFIGSVAHAGGLAAGGSYTIDRRLTVPTDLATEAWYVFVVSDPTRGTGRGTVFEGDKERNNERASTVPMIVELPPPSDLVVTDIDTPANARAGEPITISWTVQNQSTQPAIG
ncbi:MAG: hypothetical protein FJX57_15395, partial [Alphaproteobacteria bacterium]|nr:hypothetical protein [Alphaproteobacteria bacterium]